MFCLFSVCSFILKLLASWIVFLLHSGAVHRTEQLWFSQSLQEKESITVDTRKGNTDLLRTFCVKNLWRCQDSTAREWFEHVFKKVNCSWSAYFIRMNWNHPHQMVRSLPLGRAEAPWLMTQTHINTHIIKQQLCCVEWWRNVTW